MTEFVSFFIVLLAGLLFSALFNRLHLPWVIALIASGIAIGPFGLGWFTPDNTIEFLGEIGLVFLMFMAGLETRLSSLKKYRRGVAELAILNGLIPFAAGAGIAWYFGFGAQTILLLGIIFISSSIAVVVPVLESAGLLHTRLGKTIVGGTIVEDVVSLLLLSLVLQTSQPATALPLPVFYGILVVFLIALRWLTPKLKWLARFTRRQENDLFQQELRLTFTVLLGVVVVFEVLGLHAIVAGFLAGLILSETLQSRVMEEKLRAISYGLFIPVFFVVIGAQTDLGALLAPTAWKLMTVVVVGLLGAKVISGFLAGKLAGFSARESLLAGFATTPQLSTSLAVAFTARGFGLLDDNVTAAIVVLTIVTTFLAPIAVSLLAGPSSDKPERLPVRPNLPARPVSEQGIV